MNKEILDQYYKTLKKFEKHISSLLDKIEPEDHVSRMYILNDLYFFSDSLKKNVLEQLEQLNIDLYKEISAPKNEAECTKTSSE